MPQQYYCLVTGLPEIIQDEQKLSVSRLRFKKEFLEFIDPEERILIQKLFYPDDNTNLYNKLLKTNEPFLDSGNFILEELEEGIRNPDILPEYMATFIELYKDNTPIKHSMSWENQLYCLFYDFMLNDKSCFIRQWFEFDLNLKNLITALNSRKYNLPLESEIIGDNFIAEVIKKSSSRDFGLSKEIDYLETLISIFEHDNLAEREKVIDHIRWSFLDELTVFNYFSVEAVLSFLIKLGIAERWVKLDKQTGHKFLASLVNIMTTNFMFPEEFALSRGKKSGN